MKKKGQVTVFIIIGVILVILVGMFFFARDYYGVGVPVKEFLQGPKQSIEKDVRECIDKTTIPALNLLGNQGGYLNPVEYKLYQDKRVSYLCKAPNCVNNFRPIRFVEEELENYLKLNLKNCIDKGLLQSRRGYEIKDAEINVDVVMVGSEVIVVVDYPVEIKKGAITERLTRIKNVINVPFAEVYDVAYDIVTSYSVDGVFYDLPYMLLNRGAVEIQIDKPYPDVIYKINKKDSEYTLYMAVQG